MSPAPAFLLAIVVVEAPVPHATTRRRTHAKNKRAALVDPERLLYGPRRDVRHTHPAHGDALLCLLPRVPYGGKLVAGKTGKIQATTSREAETMR